MAMSGTLLNLSTVDCLDSYTPELINQYSNVILVTSTKDSVFPIPITNVQYNNPTMASECTSAYFPDLPNMGWCHFGYHDPQSLPTIDYCLVQEIDSICTIEMSISIMVLVISCIILEILCYLIVICKWRSDFFPLVTLGDAIASFLQQPGKNSHLLGPITAANIEFLHESESNVPMGPKGQPRGTTEDGIVFVCQERMDAMLELLTRETSNKYSHNPRWFSGASCQRWTVTYIMFVLSLMNLDAAILLTHSAVHQSGLLVYTHSFESIPQAALIKR